MLDRVTYERLSSFVKLVSSLLKQDYGFRWIMLCGAIPDVRNTNRGWIQDTLGKLDVSSYLARIIDNKLSEKLLWYKTDDRLREYVAMAGIPQAFALGFLLWNLYECIMEGLAFVYCRQPDVAKYLENVQLYGCHQNMVTNS